MKYNKQPLDIPALLAMLKARGLAIGDEQEAGRILGLISYFRQANYLRPMKADKETHQYKPNSTPVFAPIVLLCLHIASDQTTYRR